jgi:hypothetical protein
LRTGAAALHPIDPLRDPERFAKVSIEFGTIAWLN